MIGGHVNRENDAEDGSRVVSSAGAEGNAAALLFDEATGDPETEAGADGKLGREEGGEDARAGGGKDAGAFVADQDGDCGAGTG